MHTTAIIGGGFSGTLTAINLARFAKAPLQIVIINAGRPFGRGVAYGTTRAEHLLNVAAHNMSAFPDAPDNFIDWLQTHPDYSAVPAADLRASFVPRCLYGDYLQCLINQYLVTPDPGSHITCTVLDDTALAIEPEEQGATIQLAQGMSLHADSIVLATGNQPPAGFPGSETLSQDERYAASPWGNWYEKIPAAAKQIVILGTGLSAVDVILTLQASGWQGKITAVSRNGLLPEPHFASATWNSSIPMAGQKHSLKSLTALVQAECERLRAAGKPPAIAVDSLRSVTQKLWQDLSIAERQVFLREHAASWNALRHRIAAPVHAVLSETLRSGQLTIVPAGIASITAAESAICVQLAGSACGVSHISGDFVINCTGPRSRFSDTPVPLYTNLFTTGLARPDEMDMGIAVVDTFAVVAKDGSAAPFLYALGPVLKGTLWETVAVPELRQQAVAVAKNILQRAESRRPDENV